MFTDIYQFNFSFYFMIIYSTINPRFLCGFLAFSFLFALASCSQGSLNENSSKDSLAVHEWDLTMDKIVTPQEQGIVNFSTLFESDFEMVKLESTERSLVGEIERIDHVGNLFLILDKKKTGVFIFKKDGTFVGKIFPMGKGPLELSQITDFSYNHKKNRIDVYDFLKKKMLFFDLEGNVLGEMDFPYYLREFACDDKGNYIVLDPDVGNQLEELKIPTSLFLVDEEANFVDVLINLPKPQDYLHRPQSLSGFGEKISMVNPYDNGVYLVENQKLQRVITIQQSEWAKSFYSINSFKDHHFLSFSDTENKGVFGFFNTKTGDHHEGWMLFNDFFYVMFSAFNLNVFERQLAFVAYPSKLIELWDLNKKMGEVYPPDLDSAVIKKHKDFNQHVVEHLQIDDNPLLFIFNLKD